MPAGANYYGGAISAPVGSKIMADILPYLGFEPQYTEEELKKISISVPDVTGDDIAAAKTKINSSKLTYKVIGKGDKVVKQLPEAGSSVYNGGMVILYTEESDSQTVTVPNLIGLTAAEVNKAAAAAGINIKFSGNVTSTSVLSYAQDIKAGETVALGQIVTVYFRDEASADMAETNVSD